MLTRSDFEARLVAWLDDYPEVAALYQAGDPRVRMQLGAHADFLALLSQDIEVATVEPFLRTRDRSILADASAKGILPVATAHRHTLNIINNGTASVTLSAGRILHDGQGRPWRMLSGATVAAGATVGVTVEQSEVSTISHTVPVTETWYQAIIPVDDGLYLAELSLQQETLPTPTPFVRAPRWMNVAPGDACYRVLTDSMRRVLIELGDSDRAGQTATAGDVFTITRLQTYGQVEALKLRDNCEIFPFDIHTPEAELDRFCGECDFVYHLAGVNRPQNQEEFMQGNFGFSEVLLGALKKHKNTCPVMLSSSIQAALDNPYGLSKKAGEDLFFAREMASRMV